LKTASFLNGLIQGNWKKDNSSSVLVDYPECGIRNNDTFNICPSDDPQSYLCSPRLGGLANASWSAECMWDCTWQDSNFVGKNYTWSEKETYFHYNITMTMPRVPKDLRCLDGCTTLRFPWTYDEGWNTSVLDCSNYKYSSFLGCYLVFGGYNGVFMSNYYFDRAIESCILAILEPELYQGATCDKLGVNLWIFNPYLNNSPNYTYSSLSRNPTRLEGPNTDVVASTGAVFGSDFVLLTKNVPNKNRHPWLCSLRTPGYKGTHRCGVTLLSGPPQEGFKKLFLIFL
jgi:hypothetical protein